MSRMFVDLTSFTRDMRRIERDQVPFATALALNDTAQDVGEGFDREVALKLDRPTPFTKRGVYKTRASKRRLMAEIGYKRVQAEYLALQITGGTRRPKRRAILVPGALRLNPYGNMPKGAVARQKGLQDVFFASSGAPRTRHLKPGIYKRPKAGKYRSGGRGNKNRGIEVGPQLLVGFKAVADYKKRLDLLVTAEREVRTNFERHFQQRFRAAMATAR